MRGDLLRRLCTLRIDLPLLRERKEDLPVLFNAAVSNIYGGDFNIAHYKKAADTLKLYGWPGNTMELEAVAGRFAMALNNGAKITAHTVQNILVQAIGEDALYRELARRHPCLADKKPDLAALRAAVADIKYYLGSNNAAIAERLGISRSSLWHVLREQGE